MSGAETTPTVAAFKQKTHKGRNNVRRSTLSFDQEELLDEAAEAEQKRGPPQTSSGAASHDNERREDDEPSMHRPVSPVTRPSQHASVNEQDDDDVAAMQTVAEMRERRQRRQQQHLHDQRRRPTAESSTTSTTRIPRPLHSVTIGDGDYTTAEADSKQQQQEGGEYSADRLAALRLNAIHIGASNAHSTLSTNIEAAVDDEDSTTLTDRQQRMIHAAKTQRARQRAITELGEDYIPLASTTTTHTKPPLADDDDVIHIDDDDDRVGEGHVPVVRVGRTYLTAEDEDESGHGTLMREEDEDDVVDMTMDAREVKEQDRLLFGDDGKQKRKDKTRQEIADTLTQRDEVEVEDVDSEMEEWEVEQLRNGGVRLAEKQTAPQRPTSKARAVVGDTAAFSPQSSLATMSLATLQSSLQSSLSTLHHTNTATQSSLTSLVTRLSSSRTSLQTLSSSLDTLNERYQFYQQERDWVTAWSGMMAEKIADIDDAWQEMTNMRRKHGQERQARMRQYRGDDREDTGMVAKVVGDGLVELDEFGRDLSYVQEMDRERRDGIRAAVRRLLPQRRPKQAILFAPAWMDRQPALDGWASEDEVYDEVEGVAAVHEAASVSFMADVRGIMADVDDEWRSADRVITHFQHWRQRDQRSYRDTHVYLTLCKMLAPYVRLDLMLNDTWHSKAFDKYSTVTNVPLSYTVEALRNQLLTQSESHFEVEERPLALVLDTDIVMPWLCDVLRWEWDVRSAMHCEWLVQLQFNEACCLVVLERVRGEVEDWQPLTLPHDRASEPQLRALVRECVRGVKLLYVLEKLVFRNVVPDAQLVKLVAMHRSHLIADVLVLRDHLAQQGECGTLSREIQDLTKFDVSIEEIVVALAKVEAFLKTNKKASDKL